MQYGANRKIMENIRFIQRDGIYMMGESWMRKVLYVCTLIMRN